MKYIDEIVCGDCLEELKKIDNDSIDCIIVDPPYCINYKEWDKIDNFLDEIQIFLSFKIKLYSWNQNVLKLALELS